ncbi:MAG: ribosome maturation factor RimP [Thermodesulfobacteriota bacterium]
MRNETDSGTVERLSEIVKGVASEAGFEVVDLRLAGGNVLIFIDKPEGVNIGQCADLSREIGVLIDIDGVMGDTPYKLEVSSPGAERPLNKPADYERFCGRRVKVRTKEVFAGRTVFTGRIEEAGNGMVRLAAEDAGEFSIPFDSIEKANLKREL